MAAATEIPTTSSRWSSVNRNVNIRCHQVIHIGKKTHHVCKLSSFVFFPTYSHLLYLGGGADPEIKFVGHKYGSG